MRLSALILFASLAYAQYTPPSGGGGGTPSGPAGGGLSGTYPNPTLANPNAANGPVVANAQGNQTTNNTIQIGGTSGAVPFAGTGALLTPMTFLGDSVGGEFVGTGLNDLYPLPSSTTGAYTGTSPAVFTIQIAATGTPDTFTWKKGNGSASAPIAISGANTRINISEGLTIAFKSTTGHTVGDQWILPTGAGLLWASGVDESGLYAGITAALAGAGAGSVTDGAHQIKLTWATFSGDTYSSNPTRTVTVTDNTSNGKILVSTIPQSTNPRVIGANIWMTKAGGSTFYLIAFVPAGVTSYTIDRSDASMTAAAPLYLDTVDTSGGCFYAEVDSATNLQGPLGQCALQMFDYGARFPSDSYFFDLFPNGILGTLNGFLRQLTALPNGTTATTQSAADNSTKVATTAYVDSGLSGKAASNAATTVGGASCALGSTCAPSVTVSGQTCTLGSSCTIAGTATLTPPYLSVGGTSYGPVYAMTPPGALTGQATTLNGAINNAVTTLTVASSSGFPATPFIAQIDTENLKVTNVSGTTWTVTRAYDGTSAASHSDAAAVTLLNWQFINQGASTATAVNGAIYVSAPAVPGDNFRILKRIAPATPWTATTFIVGSGLSSSAGLVFRESSSGKFATCMEGSNSATPSMSTIKYNSPTSFSAIYSQINFVLSPQSGMWLRIGDDGVNRTCSVSVDGVAWYTFQSVGRTDFLTADEWGIMVNTASSVLGGSVNLLSLQ